jgi:hypothetical protein
MFHFSWKNSLETGDPAGSHPPTNEGTGPMITPVLKIDPHSLRYQLMITKNISFRPPSEKNAEIRGVLPLMGGAARSKGLGGSLSMKMASNDSRGLTPIEKLTIKI